MKEPLISIIIPTYNRAHLICETLNSILAQTYSNWECIVVDDGSTDNTAEVLTSYIEKDCRFQYFVRPVDQLKGPNSCRNYGFQKSCGDYINWFDSDDLYKPFTLEKVVDCIRPLNDAIVVKIEKHINHNNYSVIENSIISNNLLEDYFIGNITFYVCGPFWNRLFLNRQISLFDEKIRYLDDWDFNLRMLYQEPKINYLNIPLICYNIRENSLSDQVAKLNETEIISEVFAREKQLKLIASNKKVNNKIAKKFVRDRYRIILRDCMVNNHRYKNKLIVSLTKVNIELKDFKNIFMTLTGFFSFLLFKKGYQFFK